MIKTDVLIVGGGFVGLSLAAALGECGYDILILDQKPAILAPISERTADVLVNNPVIAVSPYTAAFLQDLGAWDAVDAVPYTAMQVFDGTGTGDVRFEATQIDRDNLGYIARQQEISAALLDRVKMQSNCEIRVGQSWVDLEQEGSGFRLELESGEELQSSLLVGADGGASRVRQEIGFKSLGWDYHQSAVVCVAEFEQAHQQTAYQWFTPGGPVALLPLREADRVAVIWSAFDADCLLEMSKEAFCEALTEATEARLGSVVRVSARQTFSLQSRQALRYVDTGIVIIGDAAHTIHPLAGQGANLGFADAKVLADEIRQARLEGRSIGDLALLRRYESRRRSKNHLTGIAMEGFHRLFTSQNPGLRFLRNRGLHFVDSNRMLKSLAMNLATGDY